MKTAYLTLMAIIFVACQSGNRQRIANLAPNAHQVVATEVIQTSKYTYVYVTEDQDEYWIAIEQMPMREGNTYFWSLGAEMKNFTGTEANRTFESIYFVQDLSDKPILVSETTLKPSPTMQESEVSTSGKPIIPENQGIDIPKAEGGITIAELYANRNDYAGKHVKIRGKVIKFSPEIMNRNWIHIQDGTKDDAGDYDLTITTDASASPGDIVVFEGTVSLDKDFGYGYFYAVIVEDAVIK